MRRSKSIKSVGHAGAEPAGRAGGYGGMTHPKYALLALSPLALAMSACSSETAAPVEEPAEPAAVSSSPAPTPSATVTTQSPTTGGDGSEIVLTALTEADYAANPLEGELGCSFASNQGGETLLAARGFVDDASGRAQGLASIGGYAERLMASAPGGFDAMIAGARFGGRGMTYTVTLTDEKPASGGESPPNPANLLLQRGDGAERTIPGTWTCGP